MSIELLLEAAKFIDNSDCLNGQIKEEPKDSIASENVCTEVANDYSQNVTNNSEHDESHPSAALTSSPKQNDVTSKADRGPTREWSGIFRSDQEEIDSRRKLHILAPASGPLAGLKGALQAHSEQMAQCKSRKDSQTVGGVYTFKPVDQGERRNVTVCGNSAANGSLSSNFISANGVIHTVNQDTKELCSVKEELGRKRISMANAAARDASLRSTPSREVHNKLEKNRRAHLKECFELLRRQLPSMEDKKISNQTILKAAFRYIQALKRKERELEHEMERLARAKIALQQNVSSLKKELQSKYDHMDFSAIMPDSTTLEQMKDNDTKSTTTASEQPDFEDRYDATDVQMSITSSPFDDGIKQCSDGTDYDQPLNLSKAQSFTEEQKSDNVVSRVRSTGNPSLTSKTIPLNVSGAVYKDAMNCFVKELQTSDCRSSKDCATAAHLSATVAGTRVTQISLPAIGTPLASLTTAVGGLSATVGGSHLTHLPPMFKTGTSISPLPPMAKVVTAWPSNNAVFTDTSAVISQSHSFTSPQLTVSGGLGNIPSISCSAITRVSTDPVALTTTTVASTGGSHALPLMGGSGLHIPAQIVTNNVHLNGQTGGIISPQAFQVLTPEGYKIVSTEGAINGSKPVTIFAQTDCLENFSDEGKPFVVSLNKNGLSTFHLTMPGTVTRAISSTSQGATIPMTSLPLNLTVGGATSLKVTQPGSASILPSYIPLANSNGIARFLPGMSVVAPLVVAPSQRGIVIPTVPAAIGKTKPSVSNTLTATDMPLLPAQYNSLINSVVVVTGAPTVVTSSNTAGNKQ